MEGFAEEGHTVFFLARRKGKLDELERKYAGKVFGYPLDVSNAKAVKKVFGQIHETCPDIDVLINNAGTMNTEKFGHFDLQSANQTEVGILLFQRLASATRERGV